MKTDGLAKHYRSLTPEERLALIISACERGDREERDRLVHAAPRQTLSVPHHHRLAVALDHLAHRYVARQLHLLVRYWHSSGRVIDRGWKEHASELSDAAKMAAYLFCVNTDAWFQLCDDSKVDADVVINRVPGADEVTNSGPLMEHVAFNEQQASAYLQTFGTTAEAVQVEQMTLAMQDAFKNLSATVC